MQSNDNYRHWADSRTIFDVMMTLLFKDAETLLTYIKLVPQFVEQENEFQFILGNLETWISQYKRIVLAGFFADVVHPPGDSGSGVVETLTLSTFVKSAKSGPFNVLFGIGKKGSANVTTT
jgi:hypothetical protein